MDLEAHSIVESIEINDVPNGMQIENGNLFVMSSGREAWTGAETMAALQKIDLQTHQIVDQIEFPSGVHPIHLHIENGNIYYHFLLDRKSTRLNCSHVAISYAVLC